MIQNVLLAKELTQALGQVAKEFNPIDYLRQLFNVIRDLPADSQNQGHDNNIATTIKSGVASYVSKANPINSAELGMLNALSHSVKVDLKPKVSLTPSMSPNANAPKL